MKMPISARWALAVMIGLVPAHTVAQEVDAGGSSTPLLQIRVGHEQEVAGAQRMELAGEVLFVADEVVVQDSDIEFLHVFMRTESELRVAIWPTEAGASRLQQVTRNHVGDRLGIFIDSRLVSAPRILRPLTFSNRLGFLTLPITEDEADAVTEALNARFYGGPEAFFALHPPPPPPPAPPAEGAEIQPADRPAILMAAAGYLREWANVSAQGDSTVLDPQYRVPVGAVDDPRNQAHTHAAIPAGDLQILQRELRAGTGTLESVQTNCRPMAGCELTVSRFFMLGLPVLRTDGTVTLTVDVVSRSSDTRTWATGLELVLTRAGDTWTVTSARTLYIT